MTASRAEQSEAVCFRCMLDAPAGWNNILPPATASMTYGQPAHNVPHFITIIASPQVKPHSPHTRRPSAITAGPATQPYHGPSQGAGKSVSMALLHLTACFSGKPTLPALHRPGQPRSGSAIPFRPPRGRTHGAPHPDPSRPRPKTALQTTHHRTRSIRSTRPTFSSSTFNPSAPRGPCPRHTGPNQTSTGAHAQSTGLSSSASLQPTLTEMPPAQGSRAARSKAMAVGSA